MRIDAAEFRKLDLRCHALLDDVPLHDVWKISLEGGGAGRTVEDVLAISPLDRAENGNTAVVAALFALRRGFGRLFGWDEPRHDATRDSYLHRLTDADRTRSAVAPGTRRGDFRLLYLFPDEAVAEIHNATVHAFLALALTPRRGGYDLYWAIYVKPVGLLTPLYMGVIDAKPTAGVPCSSVVLLPRRSQAMP